MEVKYEGEDSLFKFLSLFLKIKKLFVLLKITKLYDWIYFLSHICYFIYHIVILFILFLLFIYMIENNDWKIQYRIYGLLPGTSVLNKICQRIVNYWASKAILTQRRINLLFWRDSYFHILRLEIFNKFVIKKLVFLI